MVDLNIKLPDGFLDEEIRCDYKITTEMKQVWAVELDLLQKLLDVCKDNDIRIFATGGTMLGAVRHGGYIPWDDDIDLRILRDDYEKLCDIADENFTYPYFFQTEYNDLGTVRGHAQLRNSETTGILKREFNNHYKFNQGIFIDIFPYDYVPEDNELQEKQKKRIKQFRDKALHAAWNGSRYCIRDRSRIKRFARGLYHRIANHYLNKMELKYYKRFEQECRKYDNTSNLVASVSFPEPCIARDIQDYEKVVEMPFEFLKIPVLASYDKLLRDLYGDYHKFVKGSSVHGDVIFNTDMSYTKYFDIKENEGKMGHRK